MSDKTEQPTPKRLRESREKGDVCKSQDIPSALTVLALSVYIVATGRQLLEALLTMMEIPMRLMSEPYAEAAPKPHSPRRCPSSPRSSASSWPWP